MFCSFSLLFWRAIKTCMKCEFDMLSSAHEEIFLQIHTEMHIFSEVKLHLHAEWYAENFLRKIRLVNLYFSARFLQRSWLFRWWYQQEYFLRFTDVLEHCKMWNEEHELIRFQWNIAICSLDFTSHQRGAFVSVVEKSRSCLIASNNLRRILEMQLFASRTFVDNAFLLAHSNSDKIEWY